MPVYNVSVRKSLQSELKSAIANSITDVHCGVTGAPPEFVTVVFSEGIPTKDSQAYVVGSVRDGRTKAMNAELKSSVVKSLAEHLELETNEVQVVFSEIPARWVMEGGRILPGPGEEAEWLKNHKFDFTD